VGVLTLPILNFLAGAGLALPELVLCGKASNT
jgi:hypothetical protein